MHKIKIISPKSHSISWIESAIKLYEKKLKHLCTLELSTPKEHSFDKTLVKNQDYIALDLTGQEQTSESFHNLLFKARESCFVIGPSNGLTFSQKNDAKALICLSKLTFTHQQCKIILLEQIYRSFQIKNNTPYHK